MIFEETAFTLKDGRNAILRSPTEENAEEMLQFIIKASGETDFLMKFPEEFTDVTLEQEKAFIRHSYESPNTMMITCFIEDKIAGNCQISFRTGMKDRHRGSVAIALLQEFWNLGIGTRMFEEMFRIAQKRGDIHQIELEFIEGNHRAQALYKKMGFRITGIIPDAIRMKDGSYVNMYMMIKKL